MQHIAHHTPRHRAMLSALGIPVWATRHTPVVVVDEANTVPVWRQADWQIKQVATQPPMVTPVMVDVAQTNIAKVVQPPTPIATPVIQPVVDTTAPLQFGLQACVGTGRFVNCILLLNESEFNDIQAKTLWDNIQLAIDASAPQMLHWPFMTSDRWQRLDGAAAALSGFLFKLQSSPTQHVIVLGTLPVRLLDTDQTTVQHAPSLREMIAQPLRKRQLWDMLTQR